MAVKDYFKVILTTPNTTSGDTTLFDNLSYEPYSIIGRRIDGNGNLQETTLATGLNKFQLQNGVAVSASMSPTRLTAIKVVLDNAPFCNNVFAWSSEIGPLPTTTPDAIYIRLLNATDNTQTGATIMNAWMTTTGSLSAINLQIKKNNLNTNYPIFGYNWDPFDPPLAGTEFVDYTLYGATGSISSPNGGDYRFFVQVDNVPTNTANTWNTNFMVCRVQDINLNTTLRTLTATINSTGISYRKIYEFRTGYINGTNRITLSYTGGGHNPVTTLACVDPNTLILLSADGNTKSAGELLIGDMVYTYNEITKEYGYYEVKNHSIEQQPKVLITFEDNSTITTSESHKFMLVSGDWEQIFNMKGTETIMGINNNKTIKSIEQIGIGDVVSMHIDTAHTYISDGLISHNIKFL